MPAVRIWHGHRVGLDFVEPNVQMALLAVRLGNGFRRRRLDDNRPTHPIDSDAGIDCDLEPVVDRADRCHRHP